MRTRASTTVKWLRQGRQWLKRNLNTRAGAIAIAGGMCIGLLLRLCWVLLLLWLAPPADPSYLLGQAFALEVSVMATAVCALSGYFLIPRTAYTPPRAVIAGVVLMYALYIEVAIGLLIH